MKDKEKENEKVSKAEEKKQNKKEKKEKKEKVVLSRQEYEKLKSEAEEKQAIWNKYLRLYADMENARKMWEKQRAELLQFGNFRIMKEFTSVLDEIEAALVNLQKEDTKHTRGLNMIYKKIKDILLKEEVKVIEAKDKDFDPNFHEALFFEEREDLPEHTVIDVIQQGYSYGNKVLRPAKVKVSVKPQKKEEDKTEENKTQPEDSTEEEDAQGKEE